MNTRTSQTHPLNIDSITLATGGQLGLTLCPGKKQTVSLTGGWNRELEDDLTVIKTWGAEAVVTLMEDSELVDVQVHDIGDRTKRQGMDWHHLPIRDGSPPDDRFEKQWAQDGPKIRAILQDGGKVLIHCMGGLGRTGTVAARILIEFGAGPHDAIRSVRAARRGAIENDQQERYVHRCRPLG